MPAHNAERHKRDTRLRNRLFFAVIAVALIVAFVTL